ncbi:ubiquitin family domain-containing protein [Ditylenchus destructor]|uniref:Ubiquitin family domain-containing protein n=1 Tax=Ditylenchus destructor TaxID=166010 RepID=A0AAD4MM83_9BILA|nr:ubiquitin family domain-containing protein [Ditylenchus destructor]
MFLAFEPSHGGIPEKDVSPDTDLLQWGNPPKVFVPMATEVKFTIDGDPTERSVYVTANETWASIVFLHIVEELRIEKGDITEMRINDKNGGKMVNITVKVLSGKPLQFDKLDSSTTIEEIKRKIQDKKGIPGEGHRLIFQGKELENSTTLEECNIQDKATFTLVQKLPVKVYRNL